MTKLLLQFLLFILFSFIGTKLYAQGGAFNCDPSVPSNPISLINNPFDAFNYTYPVANSGAGFQCCGQSASFICEQFTVNTHANAIGLRVTVSGSNGAVNIKINDCSTPLTSGQVFCITGGTSYSISICTDATSSFNVLFESIGPPTINSPTSTTVNCVGNLIFQGFSPTSVDINSTAPDNPGDYNSLLDCSINCGEISIFTPIAASPNSITYQVCGDVLAPSCYNNITSYCGNITIGVNPPIVVSGSNSVEYCNGNTFTLNPAVSGGLPGYSYLWSGPAYQPGQEPTTQSITNSIAGTYQVDVLDATGCGISFSTQAISVTNPTVNAGADQTFCTPQNSINLLGSSTQGTTVVWSGGTGTYSPNNTILNPTYNVDVSEQVVGSLILTMTANNACGSVSDNVQINFSTANGIQLSGIISNITCFGTSTGGVNISVTGGSGNYTYQWSNGSTNEDLSSVAAGNYSVTVTDINYGCTASQSFTITQPAPSPPFSVSLSTSQITCFNANDGSITSTLINGVSPFTYSWSGGNGSNPNLTNIGPGTYYLDVTDANGCVASSNSTLTNPNDIVTTYIQSNVVCNGQNNGSIDATTTGGTGTLTFLWVPGNFPTEDINNLNPGNYTLTVTDGNGCTDNTNVTITEPQVLGATNQVTNLTCFGAQNGSIDLTPTGGTGPYTFLWNPGGITTEDRTNLSGGIYTVTVTDGNGCTFFTGITVGQPSEIVVSSSLTAVSCFGGNDGSINITINGGVSPLSYSWTGPNSFSSQTEDISGLVAGTYSITITDATNCTVTNSPIITEPNLLSLSFSPTSTTCNGNSNGSVDLTVSGGTSPFTYSWSNLSINEDLTNIGAGTYSVSVTDNKGCTASGQTTVTQPNAISSSSNNTNVLCNGASTGVIDLTVTGGTTPYTHAWSNNAITEDLNGIPTGIYSVTITDANSCIGTYTTSISESQEIDIFGSTTNSTCNGLQDGAINITVSGGSGTFTAFSWSNGAATEDLVSLPAGTYTVNVTDSYNCTNTNSFTITQPSAITATSTNTNLSCSGGSTGAINLTASGGDGTYTYLWSNGSTSEDITGLSAGTYTATITDGNGCTGNFSTTLTQNTAIAGASSNTNITCNGASTGAINLTATGGNGTYTYLWSNGSTSEDITGLSANTYSVVITDGNGCTGNFSTSLTQGTAITATSNNTNILCNGASTGAIDLTATGGNGTYTYLWSNGSTSEDVTGLSANTYSVVITDGNGCTGNFSTSLTQGTVITATSANTNINCNGASTGAINLSPAGGNGSYTFLWSNNATTEDLSGLTAGTYSVTITDGSGCTGNFTTSLTQGTAITATSANTNLSCSGGSTGAINLTASGGDGSFTYLWSNGSTSEDITGLSAGTYTATITDGNGCTGNFSTTLTQNAAIAGASSNTNITCNGASTGAIDLTATGGDGTYTYLWSNGSTSEDITGLSAGTYTATITDGNGCTGNFSTTLTQNAAIAGASSNTNITCNGAATGAIDLTATGGDGTYTYLWSNGSTSEDVTGLSANTYSVVITDGNGCTGNFSTSLTQGTAITATSANTNNTCNGASTGAIDLTATGGNGTYTYLWSNGSTSEDITGLSANTYSVVITDGNGCIATFSTTLTEPNAISATSINSNIDCNGGLTGAIDLTSTGGTGSYTYIWSTNATSEDLTSLAAGNYSVTITDGAGCTGSYTTTLTQPTALVLSSGVTNIDCNGNSTGSVDLSVSGGTSPYTFVWSNNSTSEDLNAISAGIYNVTVTDLNGCIGQLSATVSQPVSGLTISNVNTNIDCNGATTGAIDITVNGGTGPFTYLWTNGSTIEDLTAVASGNYSVTVTDNNGCQIGLNTSLSQPNAIVINASIVDVLCNGFSTGVIDVTVSGGISPYAFSWSNSASTEDLNGVVAGTYFLTVTDVNDCAQPATLIINEPGQLTLSKTSINVSCNGLSDGSVDITVSGGINPYTFSWNDGSVTEDLTNIPAGTYTLTVTDGNGCVASTTSVVTEPSAISATTSSTPASCNPDGTASVSVSGGVPGYTYLWSNGATTNSITGVAAGNYTVNVTDANACTVSASVTIAQTSGLTASATISTPVACNGGTAVVNVTASGGTAPLSGIGSFTVSAGNQSFTVTDANGCAVVVTITVTEPAVLTASAAIVGPILCNAGVTDVLVSASGGTVNYSGTGLINNVSAGSYTYTVTDANNCTANASITVTDPDVITLTTSVTDVLCNAGNDGAVDLTVTGGTPGFTFAWSDGSSNEDLSTVVAGNYSVTVNDANGCTASANVTINEPSAISTTTSSTPASCNPDGTASVTVSGGVPGYTYLWSNGATTNSITGVAAGNYTVNITDANNCTVSASATIAQTSGLTATATLNTPIACNGGTAIVDVTASGGTAPLGGVGSYTVAAGNQSFTVTDANGCSVVATLTVTEPTTLSASVGTSNVTCNGANDGILAANINGGTAGYSYSWSNGQSTNTITNLTPGSYNLTVTDANGCVATANGNIAEPTAIVASNTTVNVSCNGAQDGSIDLTVSGGTPGYTFLWNDPNNSSSEDLSNASAGTYTVLITDNNNCVLSYNVSLTQPNALLANSNVTTPIVVNGGTGVITVGANGGTPSYTGTGTYTVTSGTYTYTVTDANGCSSSTTITITEPNALQATATITSNILCNGGTGIIDINGVGGVAPYTGIGPNVVVAGTYTYTITDAGNATASITITITEPSLLTATISSSNITCNGANNGTAAVTASGGTAPYTYQWSNSSTTASITNLVAGLYTVTVTDANGCTSQANITISEPSILSASSAISSPVLCNNGSAVVSVSAIGGTSPYTGTGSYTVGAGTYTYNVNDVNGCSSSTVIVVNEPSALSVVANATNVTCNGTNDGLGYVVTTGGTPNYNYVWSNGSSNDTITNLGPGTYSIVVTDNNGCSINSNITITEPSALTANATVVSPILCNGGNASVDIQGIGGTSPYTNTGVFVVTAGNYTYSISDANGCNASTNITVTEPGVLTSSISSSNVTCNAANDGNATVNLIGGTPIYTYFWSNGATSASINNLAPGLYSVTTTDANGCTTNSSVTISEPNVLVANSTLTSPILCNGGNGTVTITGNGGTSPYLNVSNFTVAAGNYTYTITDANGCSSSTSIQVSEPSLLVASGTSTNATCNGSNNGTATVNPSGGTAPYTYLWSNNQSSSTITNLAPGNYSVIVTDANGCVANTTVSITQPNGLLASSNVSSPILCNGGTAVVVVSATGGTGPYTNTGNYTVNAGTYTYTVNDVNGCIAQTTLIVNQPNALTANSTVTQAIACFGGTGQISITASGGTSPYNGTGIQTVLTGTYSYTVTDLNGCSATTTIAITEPPALSVVVNGTNPLCNGTGNGSAIANPSGGTAPYTYAWSDGQTTVQATNLASGTYTVTVTDANGCSTTGSVTLTLPVILTASSNITSPILCFGGTGIVTVSASGGTSPYFGTGAFNAVAGVSNYTVTDANGCIATTSITVNQPTALVASSAVASSIPCFGGTGNIIVTATGGTPNYTGTGTFAANAGPHTYTVTDANGCSTTTTLTISQPTALNPIANITNPIACNGGFATINVSANGGTPAYSGVGNFAALAGLQNYTVIDANGCSASVSINVTQPTVLTSSITSQNVTCNGLNNGSATATGQGGTPNYTYLWSNGATTATVTNLSPGAYSVTVTDANGCQSISNVVITQPTTLSSSVVQTAIVPCFGSTGTVFVSATGGTAPYVGTGNFSVVAGNQSFTVTDVNGCTSVSSLLITQPTQLVATASQTTPILCFGGQASVAVTGTGGTGSYTGTGSFNVNAGNNTFTIQDANGCSAFTTISIAQPTAVIASFNNTSVSCFGFSNGASTATVSGGTPGYSYLWSTGSVTNTINNQFAGNYGLQVTDANGCIFNFTTSINQPAQMVATANIILPIACFGGQAIVLVNGAGGTPGYSGNGTFFEFAGTYTYTLVDQNGCIDSTTITVTQPPAFTAVATITSPIACNGGQATVVVSANGGTAPYTGTGTFTVSAGNYTYTIIDANGCTATTTITVSQPAVLTATATIINPILCNGGQATVQVSANGGTTPYAGTGIFNVVSGNYNYIVSDVNGCNTNVSINVPQPTLLQSSVSQNNVTCNGANDGSAIVFFNGGTPQINVLWSTGATTNSISNLAPGNYSVTVTDANGCTNINALTITQPNTLVATATEIVPIQCFNGNATVVVAATGGTSPFSGVGTFFPTAGNYIYPVTDANGCSDTALITINQPTQLTAVATIISPVACFGGLATVNITAAGGIAPYQGTGTIQVSAGNQSFTVTDANGCALTITLFIAQPPILNTQVSVQNVSCFNAGNGSATVVTSGGTPGYQYLWSNGDTTAITNNLIPGVYTITVTDTNGCQTTNQATITQPTLLTLSASITTPVFCFGGNATVSVSATGGTAPYTGTGNFNQTAGTTTYYVTDANGCLDSIIVTVTQPNPLIASVVQTSPVACNGGTASVTVSAIGGTPAYVGTGPFVVIAGWQNFTVTDNYGCTDTTSIFITQPPLLVASATLISPILCNGGTAVVDITAAGGTPSYSGLGSFTVVAGTYTYTVSDANGCTANVTITVTQPNPLQAVATISSPIICNGGTGVITVTGTGGTAPYVGTGSFTVAAGTYTYTITDANNCSSTVTIVINQPPVLSLSLTPININCNGFATGSITANPAGGQGPYTYVWSNGQTSQSITNLLAGLYTVTVTDNLGCTVSGNTTLTQPANPLALQESHVNILCFGNNTGSIDLSVTGGTSPYSYAWSNGSSNQDIQGLIAGSYNVTVTDANGCIAVLSVNVTQPAAPLSVSYVVSNVSCFGLSDGAIDVTPVGGTGPFTFFWTSGQSSEDLNNIPQGIYIVAITDANNCVSSAQISVTQPTAPLTANISQNPISCYGYNDGQLTANAQGGTLPYSYLWTPGGQTGSIVSSLGAGNYSVTITDANGCSTSANDVLNSPPPLIASFTASDNVVCLPSNVTFTNASIGTFTNTTWNLSNGTSFNGNQFTTAFNTLGCFDVTLLITDANGCTADTTLTNAVCVVPGPSAAFVTGTPEIDFVTGEMEFINNSQNYTGSFWTFGDGGNSTIDNPIHFYPSSTIDAYNVMLVVYDANGCSDTAIAVVESSDVIRLTVPNAFTPNGDGLNDLFIPVISNPEQAKYYQFDVFNRWGQIVFSSNKPGEGWDGKYKGKLCPFGTYNWKVSFDVTGQESTNANGHVTMVK